MTRREPEFPGAPILTRVPRTTNRPVLRCLLEGAGGIASTAFGMLLLKCFACLAGYAALGRGLELCDPTATPESTSKLPLLLGVLALAGFMAGRCICHRRVKRKILPAPDPTPAPAFSHPNRRAGKTLPCS